MTDEDVQLESEGTTNGWPNKLSDSMTAIVLNLRDAFFNQYAFVKKEIEEEIFQFDGGGIVSFFQENWRNFLHVPYLPSLSKPGWLLRYIFGPYNFALFESIYSDFFAGITVAMTLIPQALSYATLANVPVIHGIYTAILPGMAYVFFGTSMHLGLGPVALVSILTGQLVTEYGIDYKTHPQDAIDFTGEAALAVGTIFAVLSVLNLGDMINLISHPVMSGFTTAAACYIGLSQIKSAFGFTPSSVPQTGQEGYHYNYQVMKWYANHWNDKYTMASDKTAKDRTFRNHYSTTICLSIFFPLLLVQMIRNTFKATPERKKSWLFNAWQIGSSLLPFASIIIAAHVAFKIKSTSQTDSKKPHYEYYADQLKIVGEVPGGLNFFRAPKIKHDFLKLIGDVLPLALVAFMESFSVAHRISTQRNELHFLHASQELWANGMANFMSAVSSGYPASGSFSRSSLNAASGSKTAMSKAFTIIIMIITLSFFAPYLTYIPYPALAAIIWASIYNIVVISDFWHAWKHSKKDFLVLVVTFMIVFVFETGIGLAVGIALSLGIVLVESLFSKLHVPTLRRANEVPQVSSAVNKDFGFNNEAKEGSPTDENPSDARIELIELRTDVNFITVRRLNDMVANLLVTREESPIDANSTINERIAYSIAKTVDAVLVVPGKTFEGVEELPDAIVVDFTLVRIIDLTAMIRIHEMFDAVRRKRVKIVIFNLTDDVAKSFAKFGIYNDRSSSQVPLDKYLALARNLPQVKAELHDESDSVSGYTDSYEKVQLVRSDADGDVELNSRFHP